MNTIDQSTLVRIIQRNIEIAIVRGALTYSQEKANAQQIRFIEEHREKIVIAILSLANKTAFRYVGFRTGKYGSFPTDGLSMQFENISSNDSAYTIFNVDRKRVKTTIYGKKGELLKGNRFIVRKNHAFYKLWKLTGLKTPPLSDFSRYMGNLKPLIFDSQFNHATDSKKMQASTIKPINIASNELIEIVNSSSRTGQQAINKTSIMTVNNESPLAPDIYAVQSKLTTCAENCENKLISKKIISKPLLKVVESINRGHSIQQSNKEWLSDYNQ